jgi:hypothetical protein
MMCPYLPFCSMALADATIESDLALDGISEPVLAAAWLAAEQLAQTAQRELQRLARE